MITTNGLNRFHNMFSFFEWSAPICETSEEVAEAFGNMDFTGKKIKSITVIGEGTAIGGTYFRSAADQVFPCTADFCEPLQLVFADGSTFEFLPMGRGGARFAMNTIPEGLTTGVNNSNCDANALYGEEILGAVFADTPIRITQSADTKIPLWNYDLLFENGYYLRVTYGGDRRFKNRTIYNLSLCKDGQTVEIPVSRINEAQHEIVQVSFSNSSGCGGSMKVMPCYGDGEDSWSSRKGYCPNCFLSIDDSLCRSFLSPMLYKFFDPKIQQRNALWEDEPAVFDWYGVNLYTMASMRNMIAMLQETAKLLEEDYDNTCLDKIKKGFCAYDFCSSESLVAGDEETFVRRNIGVAIDFYRRFAYQLSILLEEACRDGCDWVKVVGP